MIILMNQKGFAPLLVLVIILIITGIAGGAYYLRMISPTSLPNQKACTQEAKLCPDGSSVGRTGPNCEFTPCPAIPSAKVSDETANWKGADIYEFYKSKFTFKYPSDWGVEVNQTSTAEMTLGKYTCIGNLLTISGLKNNELGKIQFCELSLLNDADNLLTIVTEGVKQDAVLLKQRTSGKNQIVNSSIQNSEYTFGNANESLKNTITISFLGNESSFEHFFFTVKTNAGRLLYGYYQDNVTQDLKNLLPLFLTTFKFI